MYGGATLQQNGVPGMNGASPIPPQWWSESGEPSAMDAAANRASTSYESGPNSNMVHRMSGMNVGTPQGGHNYGQYNPNANQGNGGLSTPIGGNVPPPPKSKSGPASNGLIRLTLKKPMGIVFEPMEDPHNPSQQRGVRICDLPRTGAAAMSGMLEVGDELLSINNKPMSRLTFDEIMDFIIDADADNVDLLFRRPKKDKSPEGAKNQTTTVKWDTNVAPVATDEDGTVESPKRPGKGGSPGRKSDPRDEESLYSGDETFYTEQTSYTEDTMKDKKRGKRGRGRRYESESFLDMLIDTVCAPVMGGNDGRGYESDDDQTFNSMDDRTYDSRDEDRSYLEQKKKKWQETKKKNIRQLKKESEDEKKKKTRGEKQRPSKKDIAEENDPSFQSRPEARGGNTPNMQHDPYGGAVQYSQPTNPQIIAMPNAHDMEDRMPMQHMPMQQMPMQQEPPSPPRSPRRQSKQAATPKRMSPKNSPRKSPPKQSSNTPQRTARDAGRFDPQVDNGDTMEIDPNLPHLPFKEITYDDQVDEQVSVMESVGGPSLLLENLRNAAQLKRTVEEDIIEKFGKDFKPDLGLTREESIQMNPERFYRHAVKRLLQDNEPEKVRLMEKLFDKYRGREEHLIRKLDARYEANKVHAKATSSDKGKSESTEGSYDGFKAFGGGDYSKSSSGDNAPDDAFGADAWQADKLEFQTSTDNRPQSSKPQSARQNVGFGGNGFDENGEDDHSSYTESDDYESIDGTSPEVIAQVSELLNYVYGKTTVAGQIDRVSTIMRAYEGRESILLELLETKALLKANNDKSNIEDLPESLRDNPGLEQDPGVAEVQVRPGKNSMMSPISNMTGPSSHAASNYSSQPSVSMAPSMAPSEQMTENPFDIDKEIQGPISASKKKKKGMFGGMFKKKKNKGAGGAFPTGKKGALLGTENGGY